MKQVMLENKLHTFEIIPHALLGLKISILALSMEEKLPKPLFLIGTISSLDGI